MSTIRFHPDFDGLDVEPGTMELDPASDKDLFSIVNVLALGGEHDRHPHVPENIGTLHGVDLWESTGSSISLPFWNTNFADDVYLYLVHGQVRVEFKEPETDTHLGTYQARSGDLMCLPKAIAHRTFSGDGLRRISLEMVPHNSLWDRIGEHAGLIASEELTLGELAFDIAGDVVTIMTPEGASRTPADALLRGLRALVVYELHLDHNEFEGGFVVHDHGETVRLATAEGHDRHYDPREVLAVFKTLIATLENR